MTITPYACCLVLIVPCSLLQQTLNPKPGTQNPMATLPRDNARSKQEADCYDIPFCSNTTKSRILSNGLLLE
jgi:hypothetical protein